jgi:hypothetical protein
MTVILFLLHFGQMFSLAILPLCPHIWPAHIILDKFTLAEDYHKQQ